MATAAKRLTEPVALSSVTKMSKKGRKVDVSGVPGELVGMPNIEGLVFGNRVRMSPYDALLEKLAVAGPGKVLRFSGVRARASVGVRSRKLGMRVLCAEDGDTLYVKFAGWAPASDRGKQVAREKILEVLSTNPRTEIQIAFELRKQGLDSMDAGTVGAVLKQMEQLGQTSRKADGTWLAK